MKIEDKYVVDIRMESRISEETFEQQVRGTAYRKSGGWWLHYEECDESGAATQTIVKLAGDRWSVKRSGSIESALYYELGRRLDGYYRTAGVELKLTTFMKTKRLAIMEGTGIADWEYELAVGDAPHQFHRIVYRLTMLS